MDLEAVTWTAVRDHRDVADMSLVVVDRVEGGSCIPGWVEGIDNSS